MRKMNGSSPLDRILSERVRENTRKGGNQMKNSVKKVVSIVVAVAFLAAAVVSGYAFYNTPVAYMSLDINPSVEVAINALNRVIGVEAANEEGDRIMQGLNLRNLGVEQAMNVLVQHAYDEGYVEEDGSTVIAVNADSKNSETALQLAERASKGVKQAMEAKKAYSAVYASTSDMSLRDEAEELGVSSGKYRMIKALQILDPAVSEEEYKDETVGEIVGRLHELINENEDYESLGEVIRTIADEVRQVATETAKNKVEAAEKNRENEKNQNENQNSEDPTSIDQNQEREQESNTNQEQNGLGPISEIPGQGSLPEQAQSRISGIPGNQQNQSDVDSSTSTDSSASDQSDTQTSQSQGSESGANGQPESIPGGASRNDGSQGSGR
jgi:hypothetical protein